MATQPASYGIARDQLVAKSGPTALVMALCHHESWWRTLAQGADQALVFELVAVHTHMLSDAERAQLLAAVLEKHPPPHQRMRAWFHLALRLPMEVNR